MLFLNSMFVRKIIKPSLVQFKKPLFTLAYITPLFFTQSLCAKLLSGVLSIKLLSTFLFSIPAISIILNSKTQDEEKNDAGPDADNIKDIDELKKYYKVRLEEVESVYKKEINVLNKKLQQQEFVLEVIQRSEQDLLQNTKFTNELLDNLPVSVFVKKARDGKFIYLNHKCEELFGYNSNEVLGKTDYDLFPGEQADFFRQKDLKCFSTKTPEDIYGEVVYNPKYGQKYLHTRKIPLFDGEDNPLYLLCISENITEIKKAEGTLKLQALAMENTTDGMIITDPLQYDNPIIFCNNAFEKITGYSFSEVVGKNPRMLQGPKTDKESVAKFKDAVQNGEKCNVTILNYRKDGTSFWSEVKVIPIRDQENKLVNYLGIKTDITEKLNAENALKVSESKFRSIVEQSGDGIVLCNGEGKIIEWNLSMEKITGLSKNEVLNHYYCDVQFWLIADEKKTQEKYCNIKEYLNEIVQAGIASAGSFSDEEEIVRKDGTKALIQSVIFPIHSEKGTMIGSIVRDYTKKYLDEEALKQSEHKYRFVVDNIKEIIFQTDAEGKWIFLNRAWEEVTGFSLEESLGTIFIDYVHPDDRMKNQVKFEELVRREKDYCRHVVRYLTKDGGYRWIEVFARLTFNDKGEISGTAGSLYDITEKNKAEEEIKANLEKERELNLLKSRMISTVSHEFRTPLTSILASTELTIRYINKWNKEKQVATLERVQSSAEFLNDMVTDVLKLNRVESGRDEFNPQQVELISFTNKIIEELSPVVTDKHHIIFNHEQNEINGKFDERILKSVIVNLITNAVKYSPNGGKVEINVLLSGEVISFIISDEGLGIPEEDHKNLFSPFFRGNNIGSIPGTGLGLSIVKKSVEVHNGKIGFESRVGKGTKFTVTFPYIK